MVADPATPVTRRRSDPERKENMQKVTTRVGVLVFVGLVCTQAAAQDVPEGVRKQIAHALHGPFLVFRDKVQEDLMLTAEQKEKLEQHLKELLPDAMKFFEKLKDLKPEEREKELKAYRPKVQEKLAAILKEALKEDQGKRLRQLELQQEGPFALMHRQGVGKDLKITDEQRKQFMAVIQELQKKIEPLIKEAQSGGNAEEIRPKIMATRKDYEGRIEGLLTDDQKKQWHEMLGKKLNLDE
jgi:Spy/CpxP family protein refolding chaperone